MKYKAGDKVRICSKEWYDEYKDEHGKVRGAFFGKECAKLCGSIQTIARGTTLGTGIIIYCIEPAYKFIGEEAIEGLVEEEILIEKVDDNGLPFNEWLSHKGAFHVPEDYVLKDENGNVINATKIVLEKKKKEYPKTYEECCKVLGYDDRETYCVCHTGANERLFESLYRLKVCRDAYWKIAGEEMGLGKPWEPDWNTSVPKYVIACTCYGIEKQWETTYCKGFAFPTEEMRDAFYENFKELIEQCKELL